MAVLKDQLYSKHKKNQIELSIVIPLFNEEACLEKNVTIVRNYLKTLPLSSEIILVDDGSRDNTATICRRLNEKYKDIKVEGYSTNRGKGYAVKTGMLAASGQFRILIDADLAVPIEFAGICLKILQSGAAAVIGSRHLPDSSFKIPEGPVRSTLGKIYRKLTLLCFRMNVSDITCGLKGFNEQVVAEVFSRSVIERWGYDAEIIFLIQKLGYPIAEMPVEWYHSFHSAVNVGRDSVGTLLEMIQIYINYKRKRYDLP